MTRFAALLTLAALLLALPAEGAAPAPKVKATKGWIESLAMDGTRVAYDVQGATACNELFVWNVRSGAGALVSGKRTCAAD